MKYQNGENTLSLVSFLSQKHSLMASLKGPATSVHPYSSVAFGLHSHLLVSSEMNPSSNWSCIFFFLKAFHLITQLLHYSRIKTSQKLNPDFILSNYYNKFILFVS
jgi:hypothetical protein